MEVLGISHRSPWAIGPSRLLREIAREMEACEGLAAKCGARRARVRPATNSRRSGSCPAGAKDAKGTGVGIHVGRDGEGASARP